MSISAVNCSPIKPQVSFGDTEYESKESKKVAGLSDVDRLYNEARKYDEFSKSNDGSPKSKSFLQTFFSVAAAFVVTYGCGKLLASQALNLFPKASGKILNGLKVVGNGLLNKTEKLANNEGHKNISKVAKKANDVLAQLKAKAVDSIKNEGIDNFIKNIAGVASVLGFVPKITTVDGNNDGIADITQEGVNAYKNAINEVNIISDILKAAA